MFKAIGRALEKLQTSDNKMLKSIRDFSDGMANAPAGASVTERLASGGMSTGVGALKRNPQKKPVMHTNKEPQAPEEPPVLIGPPILDIEKRRKRSAITRGLRMNQLDPMETQE